VQLEASCRPRLSYPTRPSSESSQRFFSEAALMSCGARGGLGWLADDLTRLAKARIGLQ